MKDAQKSRVTGALPNDPDDDPDFDGHGDAYETPPNGAKADEELFPFGRNLPANGNADANNPPFAPQAESPAKPSRCAAYRDDCTCAECRCERATAQRECWPTRTPRATMFSL